MDRSYELDLATFYKNLNLAQFSKLDFKTILKLKCLSKKLNTCFSTYADKKDQQKKYIKTARHIGRNPEIYGVNGYEQIYFLFMVSVDPTFEALKIYAESNKIDEIKIKFFNRFGLFDKNLVLLEKFYIKNFALKKQKQEISEEITKRIFK